jgi:hypothetical protein
MLNYILYFHHRRSGHDIADDVAKLNKIVPHAAGVRLLDGKL